MIKPIETWYRGVRFRSRLEARWAVFLDHLGIRWEYEPQGYVVDGRPYLPDFRLSQWSTWVEVKGSVAALDHQLMLAAAAHLPPAERKRPTLLLLGPVPEPGGLNLAWIGLKADSFPDGESYVLDNHWGFVPGELCRVDTSTATAVTCGDDDLWLEPTSAASDRMSPEVSAAYLTARSARFEHGQSGGGTR